MRELSMGKLGDIVCAVCEQLVDLHNRSTNCMNKLLLLKCNGFANTPVPFALKNAKDTQVAFLPETASPTFFSDTVFLLAVYLSILSCL